MNYVENIRSKIGHDEIIGVGAGVFLYSGRQVLLQKRVDNDCWSMHSGGLELGESVEEAAKRELFEETGLQAKSLTLLGVFSGEGMRYTFSNGDKVSIVQVIYLCNDYSGTLRGQRSEVKELRWFDIEDLPDNISPPDQKAFAAFKKWIRQTNR